MNKKILLEVCCGSVDDALEAQAGGADRIEINTSLAFGGLTPSAGMITLAGKKLSIPMLVMIRPRGGGFHYTSSEIETMEQDIEMAVGLGADGLVFGVLKEDGTVDERNSERLLRACKGKPAIFHRAFDVLPHPFEGLEKIIQLGFVRILTSGQKSKALEGSDLIKVLIAKSAGRIEILPGGGIRPHNVAEIIEKTGCGQVHMSSFTTYHDPSIPEDTSIRFHAAALPQENVVQLTDKEVVASMRNKLDRISGALY